MGEDDNTNVAETAWTDEVASAIAQARRAGRKNTQTAKEGKKDDGGTSGGSNLSRQTQEQIARLFTPKQWESIAKMPFAFAEMATGSRHFALEKEEVDTLSVGLACTAEHFMLLEPKWVALTLFLTNMSGMLAFKYAAYKRDEEKRAATVPLVQK